MNMRLPLDPGPTSVVPTLVLIHDAHGSDREFAALVQILGSRKVAVDCLEIPGYTHACGIPALAWRAWLRAAGTVLDSRHGVGARIVIGGLGTGAALATALALAPRRQQVCGVALLSPTFKRVGSPAADAAWPRVVSTLGLDRWVSLDQREPVGVRNPKTRKWIARELQENGISAIGPARIPLRAMRESDRLHAHVRASLGSLASPLLVLHAIEDEVADVADLAALVAQCGDRAKTIALAHSHHRITVDNDRQRVAHELADFAGAPKLASADRAIETPARAATVRTRRPSTSYAAA